MKCHRTTSCESLRAAGDAGRWAPARVRPSRAGHGHLLWRLGPAAVDATFNYRRLGRPFRSAASQILIPSIRLQRWGRTRISGVRVLFDPISTASLRLFVHCRDVHRQNEKSAQRDANTARWL